MNHRSGGGRRIVVAAVAVLVAACSSAPPTPSPGFGPDQPTAWETVLSEIGVDGSVSKDTALRAFALAFGPLPGVQLPAGDPGQIRSGTMALRWLVSYWDELSQEQQQVAIQLVPDLQGITAPSSSRILTAGLGNVVAPPHVGTYAQQRTNDQYTKLAQDAIGVIGSRLKSPVTIGFTVEAKVGLTEKANSAAETAALDANGRKDGPMAKCLITVSPAGDAYTDEADVDNMMAHEAWHCYEGAVVGIFHYWGTDPKPWIMEGEAEWVGFSLAPTAAVGPESWQRYLKNPGINLFGRSYDAIGFYSQLELSGVDIWKVLVPILQAVDSEPAFVASGANKDSFLDIWAPGYLRQLSRGDPWEITGPGITSDTATPGQISVANGGHAHQAADAYSNKISLIQPTPDVLTISVTGHGRISDNAGNDEILTGSQTFCLLVDGCGCPAMSLTGSQIAFGLTGGEHGSTADFEGTSKEKFCPSPSPDKPCQTGCGGSNGDPHMKTVDGSRYDLQAAGEYVLLRSPDSAVEMQARQEPRGEVATINTAVAAKLNGHRVDFYMSEEGPPDVRVDGQPVNADAVGSADVGSGATLAAYERGYELDFPDGTKLWALSMGSWGINALVLPSDSLRADGVGIIARVPSDARFRVPALPDGSTLPAPANHDEHYQELYGTFAPAWQVTAETTLFDYDEGQTTDSYVVADFPPQAAPVDVSEVPADELASALQTCSVVTDSELAEQCAFDVAVTGDSGFVATYVMTDELQSQGTASLSEPPPTGPGSTPTPPSTAGPLPSGINFVADHIAGISSRILGPNGRLYVMAATQETAFGEVKYTLLAIDPATGQIVQQADSHGPGMLAWAAGSLWAGEFSRAEVGTCQVSRIDPNSLTEQTSIPTICADQGLTTLAAVGDAVWFLDPTGAEADGTGQHLRRIDPSTNAVDASPAGNLVLPVVVQFVNVTGAGTMWSSTSAGLLFGNRQSGLYRLLAGSDTFDSLGSPQGALLEWYAAGDGVWTTTNTGESGGLGSEASFYNGSDQPTQTMGYDGYLVGADDAAVYVEYQEDDTVADSLVRYSTDGSGPVVVAQGGFVQNSFGGQTPLGYHDSLINPLLFNGSIGVKAWLEPSASDETMQQLLVQQLQLP